METVELKPFLKDEFYNKVKTPNLNLIDVQENKIYIMEIFSNAKRTKDELIYQIVLKVKEIISKQGKIKKILFEDLVYLDISDNDLEEDVEWDILITDTDSKLIDCYVLHELGTTDEMAELFL